MKFVTSLFSLLILSSFGHAQEAETLTPSGDPAPIRAVKLIIAGHDRNQIERVFFGQLAALETVDISFEVGGPMTMFDAQEGQFLDDGAVIAGLDETPFERAVERATLTLTQAERDLTRSRALVQSSAVSATQVENAETARDLAAVALREASDALEDTQLIAPFRALVASRLTPNFANVAPGEPIARLHDMSEVRVEIDVPERLFQRLSTLEGITFFGASPSFDGEVPLQLREFNAETQNIGQSYRVTLALPMDQVSPAIIPGASMTVTARLKAVDASQAVLPPSAVTIGGGTAQVMIYQPSEDGMTGTVAWMPVDVTSTAGTDITVSGVPSNAMIVAAGSHLLREGQIVRRFIGLSVD